MGGLSPALGDTGVGEAGGGVCLRFFGGGGDFLATQSEALMSRSTERNTKDCCILKTVYLDERNEISIGQSVLIHKYGINQEIRHCNISETSNISESSF